MEWRHTVPHVTTRREIAPHMKIIECNNINISWTDLWGRVSDGLETSFKCQQRLYGVTITQKHLHEATMTSEDKLPTKSCTTPDWFCDVFGTVIVVVFVNYLTLLIKKCNAILVHVGTSLWYWCHSGAMGEIKAGAM